MECGMWKKALKSFKEEASLSHPAIRMGMGFELTIFRKFILKNYSGLTILDSLDTMLIMGLNEEFAEAKQWVEKDLDFDKNRFVNLFESTIRVTTGRLSCHFIRY
jgi:hypothetical protein